MPTIQEHPLYIDHKELYREYSDFYKGGSHVEGATATGTTGKNENRYLPQHAYESDAQYQIRLRLATYKNLAKPIVSVFSASVWRRNPNRVTMPAALEQWLDDVDDLGSATDVFFQDVSAKIAASGVYGCIIDSTKAPEGVDIISKRDSDAFGIRPKFIPVSPLNLISWGHDDNSNLSYIAISETIIKDTGPWEQYEEIDQYKIWYTDRWELWEVGEKEGYLMVDEGTHPCGVVPFVPGYFRKKCELVGESAFHEVLSLIKRAYIMENTLDKSLFDTAFPQQGFYGFQREEIDNYIRSSSNGLVAADPTAKSDFIEPSGRAFQALTDKIRSDERAIQEIALRMIRPDSKQVESADSKKLDRQQLDSQLAVFSRNCEDFETNCWWMFGRWLGMSDAELSTIDIQYNRDFDVEKISSDLLKAFSDMRRNGDLSRETYWEIIKSGEFLPNEFDAVEEAARIENDQRASSSFGSIGRAFLSGTAGGQTGAPR